MVFTVFILIIILLILLNSILVLVLIILITIIIIILFLVYIFIFIIFIIFINLNISTNIKKLPNLQIHFQLNIFHHLDYSQDIREHSQISYLYRNCIPSSTYHCKCHPSSNSRNIGGHNCHAQAIITFELAYLMIFFIQL